MTQGVSACGFTMPSSGAVESRTCAGVVIEDYADLVIDRGWAGRDWAPVRRWAIALDGGRLVFANDEDLTSQLRVHRETLTPVQAGRTDRGRLG